MQLWIWCQGSLTLSDGTFIKVSIEQRKIYLSPAIEKHEPNMCEVGLEKSEGQFVEISEEAWDKLCSVFPPRSWTRWDAKERLKVEATGSLPNWERHIWGCNVMGEPDWTCSLNPGVWRPPRPRPAKWCYGRAKGNSCFLQAGFVWEDERQQEAKWHVQFILPNFQTRWVILKSSMVCSSDKSMSMNNPLQLALLMNVYEWR